MVAVIEADAEEFRHDPDGGANAWAALDQWQRGEIARFDPAEALASERGSGDVRDHAREVADRTRRIENSGFFLSNRAVAKKLHASPPIFCRMLHTRPPSGNGLAVSGANNILSNVRALARARDG